VIAALLATLLGVALGLAPASPGAAGAGTTVYLEELTWTELEELIRAGRTTIIVPTGGTEQNGPHMALGKHNARVRALAGMIARRLDNALVAPVLAYVPEGELAPPTGHMRFPGTITLPEESFQRVLEAAARSLRLHGFRDIALLGDSGPNQPGQRTVAAKLNREWAGTPVRVHAIDEYYRASTDGFREILRSRGYRDEEIGRHAGLADTSLMLAVDPTLVRADRLPREPRPAAKDGVEGDPRRASAEAGRLGVDAVVTRTARAIQLAIANR
jgi:creatinine amidohydrolase/Fe(II)-dependent formamide hydrolase-like protein